MCQKLSSCYLAVWVRKIKNSNKNYLWQAIILKSAKTTSVKTPATFYVFHFLAPKQQDCQENDGNDNANVGARTTAICQNEKDDGNSQNVLSRCFVTEFSSNQRKACVFPFKLQEGATEDHNSCTNLSDPDGKYWCSTKVCK